MSQFSSPIKRIRLNNLVIGSIGAAGSLNVDVATIAAANGLAAGDIGIACPVDADATAGLGLMWCRMTTATNLRLRFVNPSAGAIDPADTFDFEVLIFSGPPTVQVI